MMHGMSVYEAETNADKDCYAKTNFKRMTTVQRRVHLLCFYCILSKPSVVAEVTLIDPLVNRQIPSLAMRKDARIGRLNTNDI